MKHILTLCGMVLFATIPLYGQYSVEGRIANHGGRVLLLVPTVTGTCDTLGNVVTADGRFRFNGKVGQPVAAELQAVGTRLRLPLFLEDASLHVEADTKQPDSYTVSGGGYMQWLRNSFRSVELEIRHRRDSMCKVYEKDYPPGDYFGQIQIRGLLERFEEEYDAAEDSFLQNNDNLVSASLLAFRQPKLVREKKLAAKYALLGEQARASVQGRWLRPYAEKVARIVLGGIAPDLQMQTPEGDSLSLYAIKAPVKILDFWASWCGPCRAENPNLRRIYERYKPMGLEIVSVSLDGNREAWRKAIADDRLSWKHISDLKGWNSIVTDLYEIHAIPHLFVLDADNRILAERLRGEELEQCVKQALENSASAKRKGEK